MVAGFLHRNPELSPLSPSLVSGLTEAGLASFTSGVFSSIKMKTSALAIGRLEIKSLAYTNTESIRSLDYNPNGVTLKNFFE